MDAAAPLLLSDPSLLCVSAWNDNGKKDLIDTTRYGECEEEREGGREGEGGSREKGQVHFKFSDLLYRSDFFPGLGWMLTSDLWHELKPKWPPR